MRWIDTDEGGQMRRLVFFLHGVVGTNNVNINNAYDDQLTLNTLCHGIASLMWPAEMSC